MSQVLLRRWPARILSLVAMACLAVASVVAVPPNAEAATAKHAVAVSIKVSASKVKSGQHVTVRGVVKDRVTKKPLKRAKVVLQQRLTGSSRWVNVATRTTNTKGAYSAKIKETQNVSVRAVVTATSKTKVKISVIKRVYASQSIVQVSRTDKRPTNADKNGYSLVTYQVSPGLRGKTLRLQSRLATRSDSQYWEGSDMWGKIPANGNVTVRYGWGCGELNFDLRVMVPAGSGRTMTASPVTTHFGVPCEDWREQERLMDLRVSATAGI